MSFNDYLHSLNLSSSPYIENAILLEYEAYKSNKKEFGEKFAKQELNRSILHPSVKAKIIQFNS